MTTQSATDAVAQGALPSIEVVDQAATEIARLYLAFDKAAVDLTPAYIDQRLAGEEEVTWAMFPRIGFMRRPTPILHGIIRRRGTILLGAGYNMRWDLLDEYRLTKVVMMLPGNDETFAKGDGIVVHRSGRGYDPGDEYIVIGDRALRAGHDHHGSMPTAGIDGKLAWSVPRDWVNGTFSVMTEVDSGLQRVIERLRVYEPATEPEG